MNIQLDADMMKSVVSEAILKSLDDDKRNTLIQGAIQYLLTPKEGYRDKTSPIMEAFQIASGQVAMQIAREMLEKDGPVKDKIRQIISEAVIRVTETNREQSIQRVADAVTTALTRGDY